MWDCPWKKCPSSFFNFTLDLSSSHVSLVFYGGILTLKWYWVVVYVAPKSDILVARPLGRISSSPKSVCFLISKKMWFFGNMNIKCYFYFLHTSHTSVTHKLPSKVPLSLSATSLNAKQENSQPMPIHITFIQSNDPHALIIEKSCNLFVKPVLLQVNLMFQWQTMSLFMHYDMLFTIKHMQ